MKSLSLIIFVSTLCLCNSCVTSNESSNTISLIDVAGEVDLDDLFEDFEYIQLETTDKSIYGQVNKLIIHNNKFYILDSQTKKVLVFQTDGAFSHTIGGIGKGPGEYTHIEDMVIDVENEQLVILGYPSIVYIYHLNGDFIARKHLPVADPLWNICTHNGGFICSNNHQLVGQGKTLMYSFDKDFNLTGKIGTTIANDLPPFISLPFLQDGENIVYFDNFTSFLCFINTNDISKSDSIKLRLNNPIPPEVLSDPQKFIEEQRNYSFFNYAYLANDILWSAFVNRGVFCVFIKDFKNNQEIIANYNNVWPKMLYHDHTYFYGAMSNEDIMSGEFPATPVTKYTIGEESNPVILRFKPKQIFK